MQLDRLLGICLGLLALIIAASVASSCNDNIPYPLEDVTRWNVLDDAGSSYRLSYVDVTGNEVFFTDSLKTIEIVDLVTRHSKSVPMPSPGGSKYVLVYPRFLHIGDSLLVSSGDQLLAMSIDGSVLDSYDCLREGDGEGWITDMKWNTNTNSVMDVLWLDTGDIRILEVDWNPKNDAKLKITAERQFSQSDLVERLKTSTPVEFRDQEGFCAGWLGRAFVDGIDTYQLFAFGSNKRISIGMMQVEEAGNPIIVCNDIDAFGYWSNEIATTENNPLDSEALSYALKDDGEIRSYTQFLGAYNSGIIIPCFENRKQNIALFQRDTDGNWVREKSTSIANVNTVNVRKALLDIVD